MQTLRLALDVMGGDNAPDIVIQGASLALSNRNLTFLLYGSEPQLSSLLRDYPDVARAAEVIPTTEVIGPTVKPSAAVRGYSDSSMVQALKAVAERRADAVISAGNTGAYMALAMMILKRARGIQRPAIATLLPTLRGSSVVLDLGANVECDAVMLEQFAIMGSVYASLAMQKERPSVALLNVGSEDLKGKDTVKEAAQRLRDNPHLNFCGFVEGNDIARGEIDVIVTDGFTGNVALKTAEGTVMLVVETLKEALSHSKIAQLGALLARPALLKLKQRLDPRNHNGAILLGLDGVAIKSHGGTDAHGFANAILVAADLVTAQLKPRILAELDRLQSAVHA